MPTCLGLLQVVSWKLFNLVWLRRHHQRSQPPRKPESHGREVSSQQPKLPLLPGLLHVEEDLQPFQRSQTFIAFIHQRAAQGNWLRWFCHHGNDSVGCMISAFCSIVSLNYICLLQFSLHLPACLIFKKTNLLLSFGQNFKFCTCFTKSM